MTDNNKGNEGLKPVSQFTTLMRNKSRTARLDHLVETSHFSKKILPVETDEAFEGADKIVDRQTELDDFVGLYPMYWLTLTFMDRELEKEFIVFLTRTSLRSNRIMLTIILITQVALSFTFRSVNGGEQYNALEFGLIGMVTFILFTTVIISVFVPQRHLDKFFILLTQLEVIVIVFIIFGVLQYLNFHIRVLSRTTFDPFVWNGYVIILFMAVYVVKQRFIYSVFSSLIAVIGSWAALYIDNTKWTLVNSLSIPFVYGTLAATTAFYCWERERLWRNTFLLERYLAQRNNGSSGDFDDEKTKDDEKPTISGAPFERVQEKRGVFEFTRTTLDMSKIWNKIRSQAFPEMDLENAFRAWRHKAVLINMRFHLFVLIFSDLVKPFLDKNSYCDASKLFTISPSLCGSKGLLIQVLRHADLPVLFVGLGLTWSRYFHEHHYSMHILMMLILAIRGIIIELIVYLLVNWDTQDSTRSLFMSYLVTMQFGACGPYNLIYQQHAILSIPLIIGIIIVFLYAGSVSSANNIIISSLFAISCAYMDEALERNFFSLREMALRQ